MYLILLLLIPFHSCIQTFLETPSYTVADPGESVILPCVIESKGGQCTWEKDNAPVGMFPLKYEWAGNKSAGDCSLLIYDAEVEYDEGNWQCQVSASDFVQGDSLISKVAELQIRSSPDRISLSAGGLIKIGKGDAAEIECISS